MTNQRACANTPAFSRRTAMTALAASPFIATVPQISAAKVAAEQTDLEIKYLQWLSTLNELDDNTVPPHGMSAKDFETIVLNPIWDRADALAEYILKAEIRQVSDLAIKVLTALRAECGEMDGSDAITYVGRVQGQALRLVNLTD